MESDPATQGRRALHVDVRLAGDTEDFQIVADRDWARVLHPAEAEADCSSPLPAEGPDEAGHGLNWRLKGERGELFRITLHQVPVDDAEGQGTAWLVCSWKLEESAVDGNYDYMLGVSQDWECALERLEEMRRWGEPPGPTELGVAIRACEQSGAWEAALALLEDCWGLERQCREPAARDYEAASRACRMAGEADLAQALLEELREWGPAPNAERFQLTPRVYWNRDVRRMGCSVRNTLDWQGGDPLPGAERPCWLLPASDHVAVQIARRQGELREAGWKVLSCDPGTVSRLDNKAAFQAHAQALGLSAYLPTCFTEPEGAAYPCVLKPATGEFGRDARIVRSPADVLRVTGEEGLRSSWVLQELITGCFEFSTALLVERGEVLDMACTRYEYDAEEYVWPQVLEVGKAACDVPSDHLAVMKMLLEGYSGFCNFNYKLRPCGRLCIFEANARVGADLACDVPRAAARRMFLRLDSLSG